MAINKSSANSQNWQIDYTPTPFDIGTHYETLFANAALTARNAIIELGDPYEGIAGSKIRVTATITNTETVAFYILVKFLEDLKLVI